VPTVIQNRRRKKAAKAYAIEHYLNIPRGFSWQGPRIGKPARELVRRIQHHAWPTHAPTGLFDTRTLALLFPLKPVGVRAVTIAGKELGVKEDPAGSNSGPRVREFQNVTNPGASGFPWCASFVTWCMREAGWKVSFASQAYVPAWVAAAHTGRYPLMVVPASEAIEGDVVTYDWNNDRIADHIGFVLTTPDESGNFRAREGNTSAGSNSNGGEVQDRDRHVSDVCCFIRVS
jgi:hypothetical protein